MSKGAPSLASMHETPTILFRNSVHCAASYRQVFFHVWFSRGTFAYIQEGIQHHRAFARRFVKREMISVSVVHEGAVGPLDSAARNALAVARRELGPYTKAGVLVMPAEGFGAALIRSILAGITLLSRMEYPSSVVHTVEEAFELIAMYLDPVNGRPVTPKQIADVYRQITEVSRRR